MIILKYLNLKEIFSDFIEETDWIKQGIDPKNKNNFSNFLLTPSSLLIKFPAYQLGPGTTGDFTVEIPYDQFVENIDADSIINIVSEY